MGEGFSRETKEILSRIPLKPRMQRLAELHALVAGIGRLEVGERGSLSLSLQSENLPAIRRGDFLMSVLCKTMPLSSVFLGGSGKGAFYSLALEEPKEVEGLLKELGFMNARGILRDLELPTPDRLLKNEAAARAFLRGAFLASGYVSDPESAYHWEVVCSGGDRGEELQRLLAGWQLPAKLTLRKGRPVVYLKSSEAISTVLSLMGAYQSTLQWESARAFRSLQGQVNRQVNCETANIAKSSQAGEEQVKAIQKIKEKQGLESLPLSLREVALLRLENQEASLKELGEMLHPPVGKSGMNHRLRKIMELAESLPNA